MAFLGSNPPNKSVWDLLFPDLNLGAKKKAKTNIVAARPHVAVYRNPLINSGTFQTQTEFQKIYNIEPTPAEVPVIHKGKYKHLKFV